EFILHPNPVGQTLHVTFSSTPADFEWTVLDLSGRKLLEGRNVTRIDVGELPRGTYLLLVRSGASQSASRFIKE
ncbi:MAG: Secretion system C-terminal sorting domain, partial [Bacteroidota bacterium]